LRKEEDSEKTGHTQVGEVKGSVGKRKETKERKKRKGGRKDFGFDQSDFSMIKIV
jgi:hypothetical protein